MSISDHAARVQCLLDEQRQAIQTLSEAARVREEQLATVLGKLRESSEPPDEIVGLQGSEAVRGWLVEHASSVTREVLAMAPGGAQNAEALRRGRALDMDALKRGVSLRCLYLTSATRWPAMRHYVRDMTELGVQFRTVASLPLRMLVFDREVALLPIDLSSSERGAFVVRDLVTLRGLVALFDAHWSHGTSFGQLPAGAGLTAPEQETVRLLAAGASDADVAVSLGVSVRTVRRTVASLAERVQARGRFQLGVHAVHHGWLRDD